MTWKTGTFDPELNLLYLGNGQSQPRASQARSRRPDISYTCSSGLNPDTGSSLVFSALATRRADWDAVETPVLFARSQGQAAKLLAQASRMVFSLLESTNGQHLVAAPFIDQTWAFRRRLPRPGRSLSGSPLPSPDARWSNLVQDGASNWMAPSFDPQTGLFMSMPPNLQHLLSHSHREAEVGEAATAPWANSTLRALRLPVPAKLYGITKSEMGKYLRYSYNRRASSSSAPIFRPICWLSIPATFWAKRCGT